MTENADGGAGSNPWIVVPSRTLQAHDGVFIDSILECGAAGLTTLGQGSPCKDKYGSSFENTIRTTMYPALVKALTAVRAKAPKARVAILSYPWILPASGRCYPQMPIARGDVPYLRNEQADPERCSAAAAERPRAPPTSTSTQSPPTTTPAKHPAHAGSNPCCSEPTPSSCTPTPSANQRWQRKPSRH